MGRTRQVAAGPGQTNRFIEIGATHCAALRIARARQVRGRSVAVGRAANAFSSRAVAAVLPTYPVEAAVALSNSVQADELDDRCATASTCLADGATLRTLAAPLAARCLKEGTRAVGGRKAADAAEEARVASRHPLGAWYICYSLPRYKPVVPWEPEVASRLLAATVAAVRAARG